MEIRLSIIEDGHNTILEEFSNESEAIGYLMARIDNKPLDAVVEEEEEVDNDVPPIIDELEEEEKKTSAQELDEELDAILEA